MNKQKMKKQKTLRPVRPNKGIELAYRKKLMKLIDKYYGEEILGWQRKGLDLEKIYYGYKPFDELEKVADIFSEIVCNL